MNQQKKQSLFRKIVFFINILETLSNLFKNYLFFILPTQKETECVIKQNFCRMCCDHNVGLKFFSRLAKCKTDCTSLINGTDIKTGKKVPPKKVSSKSGTKPKSQVNKANPGSKKVPSGAKPSSPGAKKVPTGVKPSSQFNKENPGSKKQTLKVTKTRKSAKPNGPKPPTLAPQPIKV